MCSMIYECNEKQTDSRIRNDKAAAKMTQFRVWRLKVYFSQAMVCQDAVFVCVCVCVLFALLLALC